MGILELIVSFMIFGILFTSILILLGIAIWQKDKIVPLIKRVLFIIDDFFEKKKTNSEKWGKAPPVAKSFDANEALHNNADEITYSPSRVNNYKTTKGISSFLKLIAWLSVGAGVMSVLGALSSFDSGGYSRPGIEFYVSLISTFSSFTVAIFFAALSEGINVMLDIEANSRQTAKTLERLLRSQE